MWYYESLANQWPAPPWATDSYRFATCNVIMVQFLHCTTINLEPVLGKDFRTELAFHGSTCLFHSYEAVRISRPRRRGPPIGQRFVVPHYSRPTLPPKGLKIHSGPPVTHHGLHWQHQRKVKNTQIYEFYHFPKNGRMQCGL